MKREPKHYVSYRKVNLNIGLASVDITPEIGVYHRCWGASLNDTAKGIHKPLSASAIAFAENGELCILISADASFWQSKSLEENMVGALQCASVLAFKVGAVPGDLLDCLLRNFPDGKS